MDQAAVDRDNLLNRIFEAERQGWLGEVEVPGTSFAVPQTPFVSPATNTEVAVLHGDTPHPGKKVT